MVNKQLFIMTVTLFFFCFVFLPFSFVFKNNLKSLKVNKIHYNEAFMIKKKNKIFFLVINNEIW